MHKLQKPIPNSWYTNLTGQLFKVKLLAFNRNGLTSIAIEYLEGTHQIISRQEWACLKLIKHTIEKNDSKNTSKEATTS